MIRWSLIFAVLLAIVAVGMRDWFKALVAVIVVAVLHEHHYFRDPFLGISGLRVINLLLPVVLLQYLFQRRGEGLTLAAPLPLRRGLIAYALVLLYGAALALPEFDLLQRIRWTVASFTYNEIVAPALPLLLAVLVYDGTRSRARMVAMMAGLVLMATVAAAYIIKLIPPSSLLDAGSFLKYRLRIQREFGLHPNDVASILVPGMWIALACILLVERKIYRLLLAAAAMTMFVAVLLTQSRTGMIALLGVTVLLGLIRFRAAGLALAVAAIAVFSLPSIAANWSRGFEVYTIQGTTSTDLNEITNGRLELWKLAWTDILEAPIMGHGRLYWWRMYRGHEAVWGSHPHNAYLDIWMEYGLIGLLVVLGFAVSLLIASIRLMRRGATRIELVAGLGAAACLLTHVIVGFSGKAFLPRVSSIITFCMCALAMRVHVESQRAAEWPLTAELRRPRPAKTSKHLYIPAAPRA